MGCGDCLLPSLWMVPHVYNGFICRAGGADYCHLAVALVQVVHGYDTIAPHVAYAKIHSQRGLIGRLACTALNTSCSVCVLSSSQPVCAGGMNAHVSFRLWSIVVKTYPLGCLQFGYRCLYLLDKALAFSSQKSCVKCISSCSTLVNHAL
jgi:hypothetical protein